MEQAKHRISSLLIFTLLISLCACGKAPIPGKETFIPTQPTSEETIPGYIPTEISEPGWLQSVTCRDTYGVFFWLGGQSMDGGLTAVSYDTVNDRWKRYDLNTGDARCPSLRYLSVTGNSFWGLLAESVSQEQLETGVVPNDLGYYVLYGDALDGSVSCTRILFDGDRSTESSRPEFFSVLGLDANRALLTTAASVYLIDPEGNILQRPELPVWGDLTFFRVDDRLYLWTNSGFAPMDTENLSFGELLTEDGFGEYSSNNGHFLCQRRQTLCSMEPNSGEVAELFKWEDVALRYQDMGGSSCLENSKGEFFYEGQNGLIKVTPGMVPIKEILTLACFDDRSDGLYRFSATSYSCTAELIDAIIRFNNTDPEYKIEITPLVYGSKGERDRLLIELATGNDIDILDTSILPDNAIGAGLLVDMLPYIDAEISREDFIQPLLNAMIKNGGLYEYTDKFTLLTMTTHPDLFSGRAEWTVEEIEALMAQYPKMAPLRYGYDRDMLLTLFSWAATAEFIDWGNMTCSFDSAAFQNWLLLLKELPSSGEYDEEPKLFDLCCDLAGNAGYFARYFLKDDYVVAGFPETGGTSSYFLKLGSSPGRGYGTIGENTRLGIMASCKHPEAAWRFVRTLIQSESNTNIRNGIPVLKERFERAVGAAITDERNPRDKLDYFNSDDAQRLREQVYSSTKLVRTDEQILSVIRSEANAYFGGQKTAEGAARQIQSRISLYLAEQL